MICSRCGHPDIPKSSTTCPNCGFTFKSSPRPTSTASFKALTARRKMLTNRHFSMPLALGEEAFSEYKVRDLLGQGPLGVVYLVTNNRGDQYALKALHKRWRSEMDLDQFQGAFLAVEGIEEGERLNLPVEVLVDDQHIALRSAHLEGLTVRKVMNLRKNTSKAFRLDELSQLVRGVSIPLKKLHREGIPHGGLKPENFFVSADENQEQVITLSDTCVPSAIGISAYYRAQRAAGHGHYIAPELGEGQLSLSSDVYSLGAFIFEGITGQVYQAKKSVREIIPAQGIEPLESLFDRALNSDPQQRYRDVSALMSAFEDVVTHLDQLEGSPFNSEGTQPKNESVVARFSITGTQLTPVKEDPLLGAEDQNGSSSQSKPSLSTPLPSASMSVGTPPPLPALGLPQRRPDLDAFPIHETPPPSLDLLSQVGRDKADQVVEGPSLDVLPPDALNAVGRPAPLSISVGAPQALPKTPITPPKPESKSKLLIAIAATVFSAVAVFFVLDQGQEKDTGINIPIQIKTSSTDQNLKAGESEPKATELTQTEQEVKSTTEQDTKAKAQAELEAKAQAELEAKAQAELEAKAQAELEAKAQAELEAKAKAEQEAKAKAEQEAKAKAEQEAKAKAEQEAKAQVESRQEQQNRLKAEKEAKAQAKREAREQAKLEREEQAKAKREAKAQAKREREEQAKAAREAKAQAKREREEQAKAEREAKAQAKREREEKAKAEREAKAQAKREQEDKAKAEKVATASALKSDVQNQRETIVVPEKAKTQDNATELQCPSGMILKRTARFPQGSIKRGKIQGKRGIALARQGKAYCIDAYEYPGRGQKPKVNISFKGAQSLCAQANKRLCTGSEWQSTCNGRSGAAYPYGKKFDPNKCVTEDKEGEERRLSASGSMRTCKSASGAYDMSGNAAEWTSDQKVRGGYYASYDDEATCNAGGRRAPDSQRSYIGFRCCMDFKQ